MIEAVRAYLALLKSPLEGQDERLDALAEALDRLAYAYHRTPEVLDHASRDAPDATAQKDMRDLAHRAFPNFGFYAVVSPTPNPQSVPTFGDAINDLAEIASEMEEIEWRWKNNGAQDAAWHFRFGHRSHWGRHLHDLRSYVHARCFET